MSLDSQQVAKIASLSRLKLAPEQLQQVQEQLNQFVGLIDTLASQNTDGIEPMAHPLALIQEIALRLREDEVTELNMRQENMANAPLAQNGLFLVPRVIE